MLLFKDTESGDILTYSDLLEEFNEQKRNGFTEAESVSQYISNCMFYNNGTLKEYSPGDDDENDDDY